VAQRRGAGRRPAVSQRTTAIDIAKLSVAPGVIAITPGLLDSTLKRNDLR
jgi:hypothetical protein